MNSVEAEIQPKSEYELRLGEIEAVMDQTPEQQAEFIQKTIDKFDAENPPKEISVMWNNFIDAPLNSKSEIKRSVMLNGFYVNDSALYQEFLNCLKEFRDNPDMDWSNQTIRTFIPVAVNYAINKYFGNNIENAEFENRELYMDNSSVDSKPLNLADFKGKGIAVCAEKAAATQNLNHFAGLKSYLIESTDSRLEGKDGPSEMHAYNIIQTDRGEFLFDPTNITSVADEASKTNTWKPSIYKLTEREFADLKQGHSVTVTHTNKHYKDGELHVEPIESIYGGPRQ